LQPPTKDTRWWHSKCWLNPYELMSPLSFLSGSFSIDSCPQGQYSK
jgi:hypothetical protein